MPKQAVPVQTAVDRSLGFAVGDGLKGFPVTNGEGISIARDDAFRLPLSQMKIHLLPAGADQLAKVVCVGLLLIWGLSLPLGFDDCGDIASSRRANRTLTGCSVTPST